MKMGEKIKKEKKAVKKSKLDEKQEKIIEEASSSKTDVIELTTLLQRLQADFENYKRRTEKEKQEYSIFLNANLFKKLLPLLDNFELGLKNTEKSEDFVKGMELIYSQFIDLLKQENVEKINSINKPFDPNLHEALMAEEKKDVKPNMIIEEFQSGYKLKDRIIRLAKVKVSK